MTVQDDDQLLVSRNTTPYNLKSQNVMAELLDDDLMVVCRNGTPYKATGLEIKESIGPQEAPPSLTSVTLTEDSPGGDRFDNQSFTSTLNWATKGVPEASVEMKATVTGTLDIAGATDEIVGIEGSTSSFAAVIYTGNGSEQDITTGFATDLVWIKSRTAAYNHCLLDTLRGTNSILGSNNADEQIVNSPDAFTSFNADGFTLGANSLGSRGNETNLNGGSYVAWCWNAGDTTVTNNDGEITSQVRSNGSFSIVSYDGALTTPGSATVGHGLNTEPSLIIIKNTTTSEDWVVYTKPTGNGKYMKLNIAYTTITSDMWGNTSPTSSVFSVGYSSQANLSGNSYIAYCWAESDTQSIGQYTGNGSTDGPVINCGFEPAFVLIKSSMLEQNWEILDPNRSGSLYADLENAEAPGNTVNYLSNGFKVTSSASGANSADEPYIYIAFGAGSPNTTLTLASDANLANGAFKAGDEVKQNNSPIVPTSSEITNVDTTVVTNIPIYLSTNLYSTKEEVKANATMFVNGQDVGTGTIIYIISDGRAVAGENPLKASGPLVTGIFTCWWCNGGTWTKDGGNYNTGDVESMLWVDAAASVNGSYQLPMQADLVAFARPDANPAGGINAALTNLTYLGNTTVTATLLTLTDASGLSDFEVGDVVQGGGDSVFFSNDFDTEPVWTATPEGGTFTDFTSSSTITTVANLTGSTEVGVWQSNDLISWNRTDYFQASDLPRVIYSGDSYTYLRVGGPVAGSVTISGGTTFNGAVSITAIDEAAPSITTDGGSWSGTDGTGEVAWNKSRVWSADATPSSPSGGTTPGDDVTKLFDANLNNFYSLTTDSGDTARLTFDPPITASIVIRVYVDQAGTAANKTANGTTALTADGWNTIQGKSLFYLEALSQPGTGYFALKGIEVDGQLLVNTGIPGGAETFVTGPKTDITATFVSADPSVPSMTVSDVVGPWSSSTGNFVVNTVVNPIMIKPETSAITGVGFAPDYADNAETTKTVLDGSVPQTYSTLDNLFDGDTTTAYNVDYVATGGTNEKVRLTFNTPINYSSSVELFVSSYSTDSTYWASINGGAGQRGGTGVIASGEWVTFGTGPGVLSSIEIGSYNGGNYSSISGIRVDGGMLISGATVLNLTDDTDLNQFATGDAVYAAGVAPASFAPVIYTGNSGTQDISCGFAPDFIWLKDRTGANAHWLYDSVRGLDYYLQSNTAAGQQGGGTSYVSSFNADGFTLEYANATNASGSDYVAWCWSAGNTTVTNNDGTITSLVRSNGNFSIVSYSYGGGGGTWGHGLNDAPSLVIVKNTSSSVDWCVWHEGIAATDYLMLNESSSAQTYNVWQDQAPTSSVVSVSNDSFTGTGGDTYIAYCWADSPTQSFGSYTGNGSTIGPVIDCGFEPAFVLVKCINQASTSWMLWDSARSNDDTLKANDSDAEESIYPIDFLSTGFQLKTNLVNANAGSNTYIYAAFASAGGPSGVVGDITGLDMTLSESTGTWDVGQKVTMDEKPAASTTANLIFNSTGAVSGLTTADVPGQLVSNKDTPKLTFADGPGTGETWDEELPAGTHLRTSFVATNVEGTTSGTSNEITP